MKIQLPVEQHQKFQIGDICKIVEKGNFESEFSYPPSELADYKKDRECIILHTYSQVYWGSDFSNYSVYLLPRDKNEYAGSLSWVEENQLRFIRKPTEEEIKIVVENNNKMLSYKDCPYESIFRVKENNPNEINNNINRQ